MLYVPFYCLIVVFHEYNMMQLFIFLFMDIPPQFGAIIGKNEHSATGIFMVICY